MAKRGALYMNDAMTTRFINYNTAGCPGSTSGSITLNLVQGKAWGIILESFNNDSAKSNAGTFKLALQGQPTSKPTTKPTSQPTSQPTNTLSGLISSWGPVAISRDWGFGDTCQSGTSLRNSAFILDNTHYWIFCADGTIEAVGCSNMALEANAQCTDEGALITIQSKATDSNIQKWTMNNGYIESVQCTGKVFHCEAKTTGTNKYIIRLRSKQTTSTELKWTLSDVVSLQNQKPLVFPGVRIFCSKY
jgi:hypothetical protein